MSTSLLDSEVSDVQDSFSWLSNCFVCPFLQVHTDPTSPFPTFSQDDHPLPSIPYLDMDWSWHTVGTSLTVQKQDGNPERNMEASLFLASYVDAFCCLFDLCKFKTVILKKENTQQSSLSVPHSDFRLYCICTFLLHLCESQKKLWASATLPPRCLVETTWRKPETTHGPELPKRPWSGRGTWLPLLRNEGQCPKSPARCLFCGVGLTVCRMVRGLHSRQQVQKDWNNLYPNLIKSCCYQGHLLYYLAYRRNTSIN